MINSSVVEVCLPCTCLFLPAIRIPSERNYHQRWIFSFSYWISQNHLELSQNISEISIKSHRIPEYPGESHKNPGSWGWVKIGPFRLISVLVKKSSSEQHILINAWNYRSNAALISPLPPQGIPLASIPYPHPPSQTLRLAASTSRRSVSTPNGAPFNSWQGLSNTLVPVWPVEFCKMPISLRPSYCCFPMACWDVVDFACRLWASNKFHSLSLVFVFLSSVRSSLCFPCVKLGPVFSLLYCITH